MLKIHTKRIYYKFHLTVAFLMLLNLCLSAQITLPKVLGHNMVLQRNKPLLIWGWASTGEQVTVKFGGQAKEAVTDASGHWQVTLDPLVASEQPRDMTISGSDTITLKNILVGEVWLCSGQSNMEYTMSKDHKWAALAKRKPTVDELEAAKNPNIRLFLVKRKFMNPDAGHRGWDMAQDSALRSFSAVGYFFARELYKELHVPIGMISAAISGSRIEPWIPSEAFSLLHPFEGKDTLKRMEGSGRFYAEMIQPVSPYTLSGFLWYQGETNCFLAETIQYTYKMRLLMDSWRKAWMNPTLPFYYVQIAPFRYSGSTGTEETLPKFREAQALMLKLPNTGMAVITDLVDSLGDIHPPYKAEVGRRLSLWALARNYGKKVVCSGPMYKQMKIVGSTIEIAFDYCGSGLVRLDGNPLSWFTIAGADGKQVPAEAKIKGDKVVVSSPLVLAPVEVRFAWSEAAQPNLFNKEGLPAVSFRTNNPLLPLNR